MNYAAVERLIPQDTLDGLLSGAYKLWGGTVRDSSGQIVRHLQIGDLAKIQELSQTAAIGQQLMSLATATTVLGAVNLAVSVAGFAMVLNKLGKMDRKLDEISAKIDEVLGRQEAMQFTLDLQARAKLEGALSDIPRAFRIGDEVLLSNACHTLSEMSHYYQTINDCLLRDVRSIYENPQLLQGPSRCAISAGIVHAHTLALRGHPDEALVRLDELRQWHQSASETLEAPLENQVIWLSRLDEEQRPAMREFVSEFRAVSAGLDYPASQYQYCIECGIEPREIAVLTEGDEKIAVLPAPEEWKKAG